MSVARRLHHAVLLQVLLWRAVELLHHGWRGWRSVELLRLRHVVHRLRLSRRRQGCGRGKGLLVRLELLALVILVRRGELGHAAREARGTRVSTASCDAAGEARAGDALGRVLGVGIAPEPGVVERFDSREALLRVEDEQLVHEVGEQLVGLPA